MAMRAISIPLATPVRSCWARYSQALMPRPEGAGGAASRRHSSIVSPQVAGPTSHVPRQDPASTLARRAGLSGTGSAGRRRNPQSTCRRASISDLGRGTSDCGLYSGAVSTSCRMKSSSAPGAPDPADAHRGQRGVAVLVEAPGAQDARRSPLVPRTAGADGLAVLDPGALDRRQGHPGRLVAVDGVRLGVGLGVLLPCSGRPTPGWPPRRRWWAGRRRWRRRPRRPPRRRRGRPAPGSRPARRRGRDPGARGCPSAACRRCSG